MLDKIGACRHAVILARIGGVCGARRWRRHPVGEASHSHSLFQFSNSSPKPDAEVIGIGDFLSQFREYRQLILPVSPFNLRIYAFPLEVDCNDDWHADLQGTLLRECHRSRACYCSGRFNHCGWRSNWSPRLSRLWSTGSGTMHDCAASRISIAINSVHQFSFHS